MKYVERVVEGDHAFILPIGDIHIGDRHVDYKLLSDNIEWVRNTPNAYIIGLGDWLNVATINGKSSPFEQEMPLSAQIDKCVSLFEPIRDKIIGVISGNHEHRLEKISGYNPIATVCHMLGVEFLHYSAVVCINIGENKYVRTAYTFYVHHTSGGGSTPGGKINRVNKLRSIVSNCDAYLGGHNHSLGVMPVATRSVDVSHKSVVEKRQLLIDCGSYLKWDENYSEQMALEPCKLGSPRIRLDGKKRDIHCSV